MAGCKGCQDSAHCCIFKSSGFVAVSLKEAMRIRKKTGKEFGCFVDYSPLPPKTILALKNDDPSLEGGLRHSQLDREGRILRLRTQPNGWCIFLDNNKRCSIYSARPAVCRIFPFWAMKLTNGRIKAIPHDSNPKCAIALAALRRNKKPNQSRALGFFKPQIGQDYRSRAAGYQPNLSNADLEKALPRKEIERIKRVWKGIKG